MAPVDQETDAEEPALDRGGRNHANLAGSSAARSKQSWSGPSLAFLGCEWLGAYRSHLHCASLRDASVAQTGADIVGYLSSGVAGNRGLCPFSTTARWESVQRHSAAHLLFRHSYSVAVANRDRHHDVTSAGCALSLVSQNFWRATGGA